MSRGHDARFPRAPLDARRQGYIELGDEQRAEDSEVEFGGGDEEQPEDSGSIDGSTTPSASEAAESESVVQLRLQLALVQANKYGRYYGRWKDGGASMVAPSGE